MNPLTQQTAGQARQRELDPSVLLEQVLAKTEKNKRIVIVAKALDDRVERLRELLPGYMKPDAERLVKRAVLTMARIPKLQECTPDSFVRCVLEAAELGLAIDGRLGHAVPFKNKVKGSEGVERWRMECQFIPDYKGLVAVARRGGIVRDVHGDVDVADDTEIGRAHV